MSNWENDIVHVDLSVKSVLEIIRNIISKESRTELLRYAKIHAIMSGNYELENMCNQFIKEFDIQLYETSPITSASPQNRITSSYNQREANAFTPNINRREECIVNAMQQLVANKLIKKKQDWAAVYQIIIEHELYPKLTKKEFVEMVKSQQFTNELVPKSSSNIDKVIFSNRHQYPNWEIDGKKTKELKRLITIAERFLAFCRE